MFGKTLVCVTLLSVVMVSDCLAVDERCEVLKTTDVYRVRNGVCIRSGHVLKGTRHYTPPGDPGKCRLRAVGAPDVSTELSVRLLRNYKGVVKGYAEDQYLKCV
jgi:hypothetical protein